MKQRAQEMVIVTVPLLAEAIAIVFTIAVAILLTGIASGRI